MKTLIILAVFVISLMGANKELVIAYEDQENFPYALGVGKYVDEKSPGVTIDLLKEIAKELNINITFKRMPWKRALLMMETNSVDGLFHGSYKAKREKFGVYPKFNNTVDTTRAIMRNSYVLYTQNNSELAWDKKGFQNHLDKIIAVTKGFSIVDKLREHNCNLMLTNNLEGDVKKLVYGKVDGIVNLENRVDKILYSNINEYNNIYKSTIPIVSKPYYLLFSKGFYKNNTQLAEQIWNKIKTIKENGRYDEILSKYIND